MTSNPIEKSSHNLVFRINATDYARVQAAADQVFNGLKSDLIRTAIELLLTDIDAGTYPPKPSPRSHASRRARIRGAADTE